MIKFIDKTMDVLAKNEGDRTDYEKEILSSFYKEVIETMTGFGVSNVEKNMNLIMFKTAYPYLKEKDRKELEKMFTEKKKAEKKEEKKADKTTFTKSDIENMQPDYKKTTVDYEKMIP
jgi:hypothetical protein